MDKQYAFLEELIARANAPAFEPTCSGDLQEAKVGADLFAEWVYILPCTRLGYSLILFSKITKLCKDHTNLQDGLNINGPNGEKYWTEDDSEQGFTWSLTWENTKDTCAFTCEDVFGAFADDGDCKCLYVIYDISVSGC